MLTGEVHRSLIVQADWSHWSTRWRDGCVNFGRRGHLDYTTTLCSTGVHVQSFPLWTSLSNDWHKSNTLLKNVHDSGHRSGQTWTSRANQLQRVGGTCTAFVQSSSIPVQMIGAVKDWSGLRQHLAICEVQMYLTFGVDWGSSSFFNCPGRLVSLVYEMKGWLCQFWQTWTSGLHNHVM